jgi:hypothetical protein
MSTQPIPVVIVSYNTRDLLATCIESLGRTRERLQIYVVDNNSQDGSADMVAARFPDMHLIRLRRNRGFAAANNVALCQLRLDEQSCRYVLFLNPDTVMHEGALEHLAAFLDYHPRVGVVGPRLLNPDTTIQPAAFRFPTLLMTALDLFPPGEALPGRLYHSWWHGRYLEEQHSQPFPIDHPLGACMLVRAAALAEVGLFDERFFIYSEEVDLCYRIQQHGWAVWQEPAARVTHIGGAATSQFRAAMLVALHRSRLLFVAKHYGPSALRRHRLLTRAGALRLSLLAWASYWRGRIGRETLASQLSAYAQIAQL